MIIAINLPLDCIGVVDNVNGRASLTLTVGQAEALCDTLGDCLEKCYELEDAAPPLNVFKPSINLNN